MRPPFAAGFRARFSIRRTVIVVALAAAAFGGLAVAKPPHPDFRDFPDAQQRRVLERVGDAPAPYRRLVRASYPFTKVRASFDMINGSYIAVKGEGEKQRFVVFLDRKTRRSGAYGDHLTTHELGHVIDHRYFDEADDERFFDLFRTSPNWRDCFETGQEAIPCVPDDEVLADPLAFYATGNLEVRSSYNVPPLAEPAAMGEAIQAGGVVGRG